MEPYNRLRKPHDARVALTYGISKGSVYFDKAEYERSRVSRTYYALFLDPASVLILERTGDSINKQEHVYKRVGIGIFSRTREQKRMKPATELGALKYQIPLGPMRREDDRSFVTII